MYNRNMGFEQINNIGGKMKKVAAAGLAAMTISNAAEAAYIPNTESQKNLNPIESIKQISIEDYFANQQVLQKMKENNFEFFAIDENNPDTMEPFKVDSDNTEIVWESDQDPAPTDIQVISDSKYLLVTHTDTGYEFNIEVGQKIIGLKDILGENHMIVDLGNGEIDQINVDGESDLSQESGIDWIN